LLLKRTWQRNCAADLEKITSYKKDKFSAFSPARRLAVRLYPARPKTRLRDAFESGLTWNLMA